MTKELTLNTPESLNEWLKQKPSSWSRIIAIRIALRLIPMIGKQIQSPIFYDGNIVDTNLIISAFRACFLSLSLHKFSSDDTIAAATSNASGAAIYAATYVGSASTATITAANAATTAYATTAAAANARYATADTYATYTAAHVHAAYSPPQIWKQIERDAAWLEAHGEVVDSNHTARLLEKQPLWDEAPSRLLHAAWQSFKSSPFATDKKYTPWIRWYEAVAPFDPQAAPRDFFSDTLIQHIATQPNEWWNRPDLDINTDIARWLEEEEAAPKPPAEDLTTPLTEALDQLPGQQPAPYQFDWHDGRMEVLPPEALPEDGGIAQDYLDETREKADSLLDHLARSNVDPDIARKVGKLRKALTERAADLRPAVVDSRTITVERLVQRLDNPEDKAELSSGVLSDLDDLAETARRLCQCLPELWRRDVELLARGLTTDSAATLLTNLNALRDGIKDADIIGPDVRAAFDTLSEESAESADGELKKRRTAMFGVTVHNFLKTLLLSGKGLSRPLAEKLHQFSKDVREQLYPELVKKTAGAIAVSIVSIPPVACLFLALSLPIEGIWRFLPGAEPVGRVIEILKPGRGETPATPPSAPPPPTPPRTARPTSEKGPTQPA